MCGQIRTDRPVVIETQSQTCGEPIGKSDGVHREQSCGDEHAAAGRRLAECCLNRLTSIIRVTHYAALKGCPPCVLTPFDLGAELHLVIGSEKWPVLAEARGYRVPFQSAGPESLRP